MERLIRSRAELYECRSMTLDFDHLGNLFFAYVVDFAGAMLIAVVGWWLAGVIERGTRRALMLSPHMDLTVGTFLSSLARYATLVIVFVIILQVIAVQRLVSSR